MLTATMAVAQAKDEVGMLEPGNQFPAFALTASDSSIVTSQALEGKPYLIYFYPKADTPGCTKEACAFRDAWSDVQAVGIQVLGVSYDTPKDNAAFAEKYHLPFKLLSDSDHKLAKSVGAARPLLTVPYRISYLVGRDGKILKAYPSVKPETHAAEVLADVKRLKL